MTVSFFQSIRFKFYVAFMSFLVLLCITIFVFMNVNTKALVFEQESSELSGQISICSELLNLSYPGDWKLVDGMMYKGNTLVNDNYEFVDYIYDNTGLFCTIFQDDVRITTNITQDGNRIIGTSASDIVSATVLDQGIDYKGVANVVGTDCLTHYTPIKDGNGEIIGMFFLGVDAKDAYSAISAFNIKLIFICLGSFLIGSIMILFVAKFLTKPIDKIISCVKQLASGDMSKKINIESKDEFGLICYHVIEMAKNLNSILYTMQELSMKVDCECEHLSQSSEILAEGATEQAGAVEELTATSLQVDEQSKVNAQTASEANSLIRDVMQNTRIGNESMKGMQLSMEEIGTASSNISTIIKTIEEIAFQTNILALNAAVEAARAGQHGKGFAVVAEEVRVLAAKSAKAADETNILIQETIHKVAAGVNSSELTSQQFKSILQGIDKVSEIIQNVYESSSEQSEALSEISKGLAQISHVTQTISSSSQETAASSSELAEHSHTLRSSLDTFKLRK